MTEAVLLSVRVTPRSGRDAVEGPADDGAIRIRTTAPPVDGAANRAVAKLVASALGIPKSSVTVVAGASSRNKRLSIDGVDAATVRTRWPGISLVGPTRT